MQGEKPMTTLPPIGRRSALGLTAGAVTLFNISKTLAQPAVAKVALLAPLSGPWARAGQLKQMGAELAIEEINASGGIKSLGGMKMQLVAVDAGDSVEKAKSAAQRLVAQEPELSGGSGCWLSSFTLAATEVTERVDLPWCTLSYSDAITSRGFKFVFQTSPTAQTQARAMVPAILELATRSTGKRPTKVAFIGDNTASPVAFMKAMRDEVVPNEKLNVVADEVYTPPLADATTMVQKIRSGRPDFVMFQSTTPSDNKLLLDKFAELGMTSGKVPQIAGGGHWCTPEMLKLAGKERMEGLIVGLANWPGKKMVEVEKRFMAKTGEPWFGHDSIFAYAHTMIFKAAMEQAASTDRVKVAEAIRALDTTTGPADCYPDGRVRFDANGRRSDAQMAFVQWKDGHPRAVNPESIAVTQAVWPKS
jgi:branched-chain amino acid transport system substrate-binding protein